VADLPPGLVEALRDARRVVALTGSGISAESGVPTFRDAQTGLWASYDPQELATPEAFARDPELVWKWYAWRRGLVEGARPNAGHMALAYLERRAPVFSLVTQNVDGLHQEAGSSNVVELHGNIRRSRCSAENVTVEPDEIDRAPPLCPNCGSPLRPDVVLFGEALPAEALRLASEAARSCDVLMSVGTSGLVYPAASLPYEALDGGATVIEVNPVPTPLSTHADFAVRGRAGEVLPRLVGAAFG
jgi:NAD-dependent deacetylase